MTAVGDVLELSYGKALKASDRDGGPVPVVGSGGIVGGHSIGITDSPTIVVGRKGSIGSVTWIDGPAWPIDTAYFVKPRRDDLDRRWAFWMLRSLGMETLTTSAAIPGLNRDDVYRLSVEVPALPEQRRIAAILDHADALLAKRRQVLTHLGSLTPSIFTEMFPGEPEPGRVPLSDLATLVTKGTTPTSVGLKFSSDGVPFLRAQNLQHGTVAFGPGDFFIDEDADLALKRSRIMPRDLLISIAGTIGRVALVPDESPTMNCNQAVAIVRLHQLDRGPWLRAWLASSDALSQIGASAVTGTISNLSLGQIRQLRVPVVGEQEVEEFNRRSVSVEGAKNAVADAAAAEHELFNSLQTRAFRGEL